MKRQFVAAAVAATLALGLAACGTGGAAGPAAHSADPKAATGTLTVWLMNDAQTSWPELVGQVNDEFAAMYPDVTLKLSYQNWADKVGRLDDALKQGRAPDVVELGNTETMKYILDGSLAQVNRNDYENSDSWIRGLENTCTYQDKLFCVPYYAGARVGVYNSAMFQQATGSADFPATEDALLSALDKLQAKNRDDRSFSPLYLPGPYWYAAMSYVAAYGGTVARFDSSGNWHGTLEDPKAQQGIQHFVDLVRRYNHGDLTVNELHQSDVLGTQKAAMIYGNGWEATAAATAPAGDPALKTALRVTGMPGPNGKPLPSFIGGSDLAITAKSQVSTLASAWIRLFTSARSEQVLADKNILPNNLTQLAPLKDKPQTAAAANAVPDAWFTPIAPGWSAVEKQNVLPAMLSSILAGTSVDAATRAADAKINQLINNPS
ncbi:N,N'-diacetylchitobiose transport system substrate-binding protein [Kitasatospora sp. MAA4]|uniref:extracellular solute-binding protein n=1 Tax=Kitasatospora sp. MAA4 TaxID=3035093 RepID=UPI002473A4EB|nr:extracellular solute-binding protein [Kitasatospora sp. MAA4]MDH6132993.1 N,N'-diacetylchitobiose transport system substrate-binding protein [Kitasatospora sp. MAA4]